MEKKVKGSVANATKPDFTELEKAKSHVIVEIIEYIPNSVVSKTIIKKNNRQCKYYVV